VAEANLVEIAASCRQADGLRLSVLRGGQGDLYLLMQFADHPDDDRLLRLEQPVAAYLAGVLAIAAGATFA
jgi:hypothetical protein